MVILLRISAFAFSLTLFAACAGDRTVSGSSTSPSHVAPPTPQSSNFLQCEGVQRASDLETLALSGASVALLRTTVRDAPASKVDEGSLLVPVDEVDLLAGELPDGQPREIRVPAIAETGIPPGEYLLLVGDDLVSSRYFLSNGVRGLFIETEGRVSEVCDFDEGSGAPTLAPGDGASVADFLSWAGPAISASTKALLEDPPDRSSQ